MLFFVDWEFGLGKGQERQGESDCQESLATLQRQVRRYRSLVLAIAKNVWVADPSGQKNEIVHGESVTTPGVGWVPIGDRLNAMHPDDRVSIQKMIAKSLATFAPFRHEARVLDDTCTVKQISLLGVPVRDESGRVEEWIGLTEDITLRKAEASRIADELEWRRVSFEQSLDPIVVLENDGAIFECNSSFCKSLGYTRDELRTMRVWEWDAVYDQQYLLTRLAGLQPPDEQVETKHRRKDGSLIDVEVSVFPICLQGRRLTYCLHRDVTKRKENERTILRQSELQRLVATTASRLVETGPHEELVINALRQLLGRFGIDGFLYYNANLDHSNLELVASEGVREVPPDTLAFRQIKKLPIVSDSVRAKVCCVDNHLGMCPVAMIDPTSVAGSMCIPLVADGQLMGVLSLLNYSLPSLADDVLEAVQTLASLLANTQRRKHVEAALREHQLQMAETVTALRDSSERFRQLAEHVEDVFWIFDTRVNKYIYFSPAFERLIGFQDGSFTGTSAQFVSLIHDDDRKIFQTARQRQLDGSETTEEYRITRADGRLRWVVDRATPIANSVGYVYRIVGALRDITERVEAQEKLAVQQAELLHVSRLNTLGLMSAAISHELNQPLSAIANFSKACELLLADPSDAKIVRCQEYFRQLNSQSLRAGDILHRLLEFGRRSPTRKAAVQINQILKDSLSISFVDLRNRNVRIDCQFAGDLPIIQGDQIQLQQVIVNLLSNAADSMDKVPRERKLILLRSFLNGEQVVVEMEDRGCGISQALQPHLFQPFNSTKQRGSGIGLSICKTIVEAHGGEISAKPASAEGTVFCIKLPVSQKPKA